MTQAWIPQNIPVGGPPLPPRMPTPMPPTPPTPPKGKDGGKPQGKPATVKPDGKTWNHPEKIDSWFGWLLVAVVGGCVFMMLGQNLMPYWQYGASIASHLFEGLRGSWLLFIPVGPFVYWGSWVFGGLLGVALFTVIQYTEIRPQLLWKRLPKGAERNRRLTGAFILLFVALALDVWFCFLFWPPVNSALGWGVFRAGFSWSLVNKWNMIRTFATLFGGIIFLFVKDFIAKYW